MVLVLAELQNGKFKNATFSAVTAASEIAGKLSTQCVVLVLGKCDDPASIGEFGASKVYHIDLPGVENVDSKVYTSIISELAVRGAAKLVIVSHTSTGRAILGALSVKLASGFGAAVSKIDVDGGKIAITRSAFSGKAIEHYSLTGAIPVVSLLPNATPAVKSGAACPVETPAAAIPESIIKVREVKRAEGRVPLPEASKVVSAGRGLKDPSNWKIIEDLAEALDATTACSRPVADSGWRPHHEHVGQTGLAIRPNLYIAIGISGAIQHLAGVNNSKVIVVINKDPEAPFFKAADYGVCGDLFEIVPKLTEAVLKVKESV